MGKSLIAALLLGAVTVAGFAPLDFFPLPLFTVALLFMLWRGANTARYAALIGMVWGLGFFLAGVSWVYVSLHDVGEMIWPLAAATTLLFCGCLAVFPAMAGFLSKRYATSEPWRNILLVAGLWTLSECLRGWLFTGFPWLSLGYSQAGVSPLAGYAPIVGGYGVTLGMVLISAILAYGWWRWHYVAVLLVLILVGALLRQVPWTMPTGNPVSVSLLQGNIPQNLKWDPARVNLSFDTYRRLAHDNPAQLIVLPETAIPLLLDQIPRTYLGELAGDHELMMGVATRAGNDGYQNAAVIINRDGLHGQYAKSHLVPFGEFVPSGFGWFFDWVRIPMTDFMPGTKQQNPLEFAGLKVAVNICYEDLFGEEIIRQLPEANVLINLSNTAWFGHSLAQPQHLQIARMRTIETGRPMLRATNTGMTAMIAVGGAVTDVLPAFTDGALTVNVQGYGGATPYVLIGNLGVLFLSTLALIPALLKPKGRVNN